MENVFTKKDPLLDVINQVVLGEKKLTDAELKKREEIAQAIERENPGMDMGKKMAIATAQAKKVAEEVEQIDEYEIGQAANGKFYDDEGNEVKRIHRANRRHVMNYNHSYGQDRPYKPGGHYASREQDKSKQTKNEEVGVSYKDFIDRLNNQE